MIPELRESRSAPVGTSTVRRALPLRGRRMIGPWCFADHMGPDAGEGTGGVGVHPHSGLATVTWLLDGELRHRDSLGSDQVIRPGQLNLMTAGRGVSHAEEGVGRPGALEGIHLWVALPDATLDGSPAFEHHDELPAVDLGASSARVLVGTLSDAVSPARADSPTVGAELSVRDTTDVPLDPAFDYGLVVLRGRVVIDGVDIVPGHQAYLGSGHDEVRITGEDATAMLLGGVPWPEPVAMWWNFVGRDRAALARAGREWNAHDGRFGDLTSRLGRIDAPLAPWSD